MAKTPGLDENEVKRRGHLARDAADAIDGGEFGNVRFLNPAHVLRRCHWAFS